MADKYAHKAPKRIPPSAAPKCPHHKEVPGEAEPARLDDSVRVTWRFSRIDWDSPWHWGNHPGDHRLKTTFEELAKLDAATIGEFRNDTLRPRYLRKVSPRRLSDAAKSRWNIVSRGFTESAELYHFDVNRTRERVWAVFVGGCLYLVWWEDDVPHQILPPRG